MSERSSEEASSSGEGSGSSPGGQAGGNKDNSLYDKPSGGKRKLIRLLTVMAYVMSVSMAAIMLSLYYVFLWDPYGVGGPRYGRQVAPAPQSVVNTTGLDTPSYNAHRQQQSHNETMIPEAALNRSAPLLSTVPT